MRDKHYSNSKFKISLLGYQNKSNLIKKICETFGKDRNSLDGNSSHSDIHSFLWENEKTAADLVLAFCKDNLPVNKTIEDFDDDNFILSLLNEVQDLTSENLKKINASKRLTFKALDANLISYVDLERPNKETTDRAIKNSFRAIFFVIQPSNNNVQTALDLMFDAYLETKNKQYLAMFQSELSSLLKRTEKNLFDIKDFKYSFKNKEQKNLLSKNTDEYFTYKGCFF